MHGIIYDPSDEWFVRGILEVCEHIAYCPDCQERARSEALDKVQAMFDAVNVLTMHDVEFGDYHNVIEFCERWIRAHEIMQLVAMPVDTSIN